MAKNKVLVIGLKEFQRDFVRTMTQIFNRTYYLELGKLARQLIYARTKEGFGVSSDTEKFPDQKPLKAIGANPNYLKFRSKLQQAGKLGRFAKAFGASPGKSNLTLTGQMLESINIEDLPTGFRLSIADTPRESPEGGPSQQTNADVALYVSNAGRPFFALTDKEQIVLFRRIENRVRRELRKLNKK